MRSSGTQSEKDRTDQTDAWVYVEEMTHRTLNGYTAMLAIVGRAARLASDPTSAEALADVAIRLRAAAASCQALKPPADGNYRDLDQELEGLCASLSDSILTSRGVTLTLSSDQVTLGAHRCWQISLIISELVSNAARHAFRQGDTGSMIVKVRVCDQTLHCAIIDDGVADSVILPGRGTAIVNAIINDLGGTITRSYSQKGSIITFSVRRADVYFLPKRGLRRGIARSGSRPLGFVQTRAPTG